MITLSTALILSRRRCDSYCIELKHDLYVGVVHHGLSYTFNRTLEWSMRQISAVVAPAKVPACQCQQVSAGCHRNRAAACARRESPFPSIKPPPPLCQPIFSHRSLTLHSCTFSPVNNKYTTLAITHHHFLQTATQGQKDPLGQPLLINHTDPGLQGHFRAFCLCCLSVEYFQIPG
jgi:hypothetical protein